MSAVIFWLAVILIAYAYVGFPIVVVAIGLLRNKTVDKKPFTPSVSLIIAAHNEAKNIRQKLDNTLALSYPSQYLDVVVASDGSTDDTETIVKEYEGKGIRLLCLPRQGKIGALDEAVERCHGEILVFTDANTLLESQALKMITRNFSDKKVGGVCGNQRHMKDERHESSSKGEGLYWRYDRWLKQLQSRTGSIVSADGAIYAIRKDLYETPASESVTDDFVISVGVIAKGYRLVYEADALASESVSEKAIIEFGRKVRIINGGLRGVFIRRALLNPFRYGIYSLILFSHKVLRRIIPLLLILLIGSSIVLGRENVLYGSALAAQEIFYLLAVFGFYLRNTRPGKWKVFYVPFFYCLVNAAAFVAVLSLLRGYRVRYWEPDR